MSRVARVLPLAVGLALAAVAAGDSVQQGPPPARAEVSSSTYDVLPTGGGLEDCGCTGGARARARIELGLIPGHPPQDVPEIVPSSPAPAPSPSP